jgi:hypothetical protein
MKLKRKSGMVIKKDEGETYIFKNGVAKIPGMFYKNPRRQCTITLKEFKGLTNNQGETK